MKTKEKEKEDTASPPPAPEKVLYDNRIKRKNVLALNEKVAALREYEKMPVYKRIGRMFHCSPDQIKRIVLQKESILEAWEQRTRRSQDAKTLEMKVVRVSMLGKAVYDWIRRMMYYKDFMITDGLIQKMALQFKSSMRLQNFFPHQDWCDKFRQTYNITENDSKLLNIAYTQGFSVQIKDVVNDVLNECTPDADEGGGDDDDDDDDCDGDDDDEQEDENGNERQHEIANRRIRTKAQKIMSKNSATTPLPQLQPIRQLVALPFQGNQVGMGQKVLVATPIAAPGQRHGAAPMTMTIIPLATIGQPAQQQTASEKQTVPAPIIKQEIKEEPMEETLPTIKQECITDDEEDVQDLTKEPQEFEKIATSVSNESVAATILESAVDFEDLALSSLRKLMQNESSTRSESENSKLCENAATPAMTTIPVTAMLPAPPPLTKAPTAPMGTVAPAVNRTANKRKLNTDSKPPLPPIESCAEARKYLKLLEDFALVKENYRLIGLITRADEVLRELDGNEDVDVD